ncbi:MAG: DUF4919 domain-containing protein [Bacteroidales bacterium]|nr:DUF4919 domain-containing protein [Bacteroidales bacterium]
MKKLAILIIALLLMGLTQAQDAKEAAIVGYTTPNYEQIKKDCTDKHSFRYYPNLVKRFAAVDTSLQVEDLQTLYYGQAFLDGYNPYQRYDEFDQIRAIMNKDEAPTIEDTRMIVKLANAVIAKNPAEPMAYYYKFVGQSMACEYFGGDTAEMQKSQLQFQMLFYTIASTGNGITPEVAMHVVNTSHEYMMMNMYGFSSRQQALMSIEGHNYDMFVLDSNDYAVDTLYFNIDRIVGAWSSLFDIEEEDEMGPITSYYPDLGVKFVLELKKPKRKNSQFVLVSEAPVYDTLIFNRDSLFKEPVPENQIVGYFCHMRLSESSEKVYNCLVFISNCKKDWLYYDTYIATIGHTDDFSPTSNEGMPRGVMMNEMWLSDVRQLRITNIRTKK